jgi:hypothetical protein
MLFHIKWNLVRNNKANESSGNFIKALILRAGDLIQLKK